VKTKIALMTFVAGLVLAASSAQAAEWSDTSVHYWGGTNFAEPGTADSMTKNIISFEHVSGYKYGSNFFNIDMLFSSTVDNVHGFNNVPTAGSTEVYAVYRHTLSFSKISGAKVAFGPIRDVGLELGADANTKNNAFASRKIMPIGSLKFSVDVPGFLDIGLGVSKEWNDNAFTGTSVRFDAAPTISTAWGIPVVGELKFEGFANVVFPKGKDAGGNQTVTEILMHPKFMYDLATLWGGKGLQAGVGFQYWINKFGNDHTKLSGCNEKATFGELAFHL
jgi:nucleoside-specific outer membrane channel protein Tsx